MKTAAFVFVLLAGSLSAATAPDSLAGKVYREIFDNITARTIAERTVVLGPDAHFVYLKYAVGSPLAAAAPNKVFLQPSPGDGTYVYQRTGEATATLDLTFANGTKETHALNFTSPTGGGISDPRPTRPFHFILRISPRRSLHQRAISRCAAV